MRFYWSDWLLNMLKISTETTPIDELQPVDVPGDMLYRRQELLCTVNSVSRGLSLYMKKRMIVLDGCGDPRLPEAVEIHKRDRKIISMPICVDAFWKESRLSFE